MLRRTEIVTSCPIGSGRSSYAKRCTSGSTKLARSMARRAAALAALKRSSRTRLRTSASLVAPVEVQQRTSGAVASRSVLRPITDIGEVLSILAAAALAAAALEATRVPSILRKRSGERSHAVRSRVLVDLIHVVAAESERSTRGATAPFELVKGPVRPDSCGLLRMNTCGAEWAMCGSGAVLHNAAACLESVVLQLHGTGVELSVVGSLANPKKIANRPRAVPPAGATTETRRFVYQTRSFNRTNESALWCAGLA